MNHNVEHSSNTLVGRTTRNRASISRAIARIQGWLRPPDHGQLNRELSFRLEERRNECARIALEGRVALQGLPSFGTPSASLEQGFSDLLDEFVPAGGAQFRIFVIGRPKTLNPAIQEQVYLVGREALLNALRHSDATRIEADVEYLPRKLRVVVYDNGSGINPQVLQSGRNSHGGLLGMHERARDIGAQVRIWSRRGVGTAVEISIPSKTLSGSSHLS